MLQITHYRPKGNGMMIEGLKGEMRHIRDAIKEVQIYIR